MTSIVVPVPVAELPKLATKQLLALRDRLLACEESMQRSDASLDEIDPATIRFKDDPRWVVLYDAVKTELATREHVPGGDERRAVRKQRARSRPDRAPRPRGRR